MDIQFLTNWAANHRAIWETIGRFHVVIVHFPIALVLVAAVVEGWRVVRNKVEASSASVVCMFCGAVTALLAAGMGWVHKGFGAYEGDAGWTLAAHQWVGIAAAGMALFAVAALVFGARGVGVYRVGVLLSAVLVAFAGHYGGALTHGEGYLTELVFAPKAGDGGGANVEVAGEPGTLRRTLTLPSPGVPGEGKTVAQATTAPATQASAVATARPADGKVDFARDVEPIFAAACYECHGASKHKGGLRLDVRDAALKGGNSGALVVAGKSKESLLIQRVKGLGGEKRMPIDRPALSAAQVGVLAKWVDEGAVWPEATGKLAAAPAKEEVHWAYAPIRRPAVPAVTDKAWGKNEVDAFVLARLETEGLAPSPEADRETLIRRVTLDLTGLPPTQAEVDDFLADTSDDAYEKVVDRLMASPHYGERMAVYWLDLVRFGDTLGIHNDTGIPVTPYRDWVIEAINRNEPFDRFTTEQLAGDLLPGSTRQQKVASAYNRLLITSEEGGAQPKEYTAKYAADRVRNFSGVWLGATMGCCECHNHKYDPYTAKDFYRMEAFFADVSDNAVGRHAPVAIMPLPDDAQQAEVDKHDAAIVMLKAKLDVTTPELEAAQAKWEESVRREVTWRVLEPSDVRAAGGAKLVALPDGSVIAGGTRADKETYTFVAPLAPGGTHGLAPVATGKATTQAVGRVTAIRVEVLPDVSLPGQGPGRADNGNFVLTSVSATVTPSGKVSPVTAVRLANASADFSQDQQPVTDAIDRDAAPPKGWAVMPEFGKTHTAVFEAVGDVPASGDLAVELDQQFGGGHVIGRFRVSVTDAERPVGIGRVTPAIEKIVKETRGKKRSRGDAEKVRVFYRSVAPELDGVRADLKRHEEARAKVLEAARKCEVTEAMKTPRTVRVLARGNWQDDGGEVVTPAVPAFMAQVQTPGGRRATRLDLARWVTDPKRNPMTPRVVVNRWWRLFFGIGISKSVDDFGVQGEKPVDPELLDWLADEFVQGGWDCKHVVRLMVTSAAYRQSSAGTKALREKDPFNRLVARQSPVRLDAEFIRDNALAVGGILNDDVGGESSKPYQPDGYWDFLNFPKRTYPTDHGAAGHRRGVYTWWQRTFVHPWLLAFDATTREECVAARAVSNTPLQALDLLNDPIFVEAARCFAARIVKEGGATADERIGWAYRELLARKPSAEEAAVLAELLEKHRAEYASDAAAAKKLVSIGDEPVAKDVEVVELAAWTDVARAMINLHETITRF